MPRPDIKAQGFTSAVRGDEAKSTLVSRNVTVSERRTSVRLEPEMWMALKEISKREKCTIHDICNLISLRKNKNTSLTAAIRVFLMLYFRASSTEEGHRRAGHSDFEHMKMRTKILPKSATNKTEHRKDGTGHDTLHPENILPPNANARYMEDAL